MGKRILIAFLLYPCLAFAEVVSIVSFNAENLFDTRNDTENPRDDTYLPLSIKDANRAEHDASCNQYNSGFYLDQCKHLDWSESVYSSKLQRFSDVIKSMPFKPDVIVIPETENKKVLDDLVNRYLTGYDYSVIQLDTSDKPISRGIDVGMLTRLPIVGTPQAHVVNFKGDASDCGKTRDILEVVLELPDRDQMVVYGVHFPSGRSPTKCRIRAFRDVSALSAANVDSPLKVMAGDFNFNCNETSTDAFARLLYRGNWFAPPEVLTGCEAPGTSKFTDYLLENWHTWSYLDVILVSKEFSPSQKSEKNWFADLGSFQTLVVHPEQVEVDTENEGYIEPKRFDPLTKKGVSDHWPVGIRLIKRRY